MLHGEIICTSYYIGCIRLILDEIFISDEHCFMQFNGQLVDLNPRGARD